jgi:hypothetical protein
MADPWSIGKCVSAAILLVYLVIQIAAVRRLTGDRKRRSRSILLGMVVLEGLSISVTIGSREAGRVGIVVVGVAAVVAIGVLSQMLRGRRDGGGQELSSSPSR